VIASTSWGVLVAEHQRVNLAQASLVSRNIDHFIPLKEIIRVVRGRRVREMRFFLGNYILIAITSSWRKLMHDRGVAGLLMNELGYPAQVLPRELAYLREICVNGVYRPRLDDCRFGFRRGDSVVASDGPFTGFVGRFDDANEKRETAIFNLFGQETKVSFAPGKLIAA
jgi:transcription antitermination factor NusG